MKKLLIPVLFLLTVAVNAQDKPKSSETYNLLIEGKGMSGIAVGRSTMDDIVKKFGKDYKWVVNKKYSFQMNYYKLGLAFYICQSDPRKQIFVIETKAPYKSKTNRGIVIRKSTLEDVQKAYGKRSGTEYRGISFYYNKIDGKNIITEIDVTENSGIRQCKVAK